MANEKIDLEVRTSRWPKRVRGEITPSEWQTLITILLASPATLSLVHKNKSDYILMTCHHQGPGALMSCLESKKAGSLDICTSYLGKAPSQFSASEFGIWRDRFCWVGVWAALRTRRRVSITKMDICGPQNRVWWTCVIFMPRL